MLLCVAYTAKLKDLRPCPGGSIATLKNLIGHYLIPITNPTTVFLNGR